MALYKLSYAEEHLAELFQEAHDGGEVFILRRDGLSCQLVATAGARVEEETVLESEAVPSVLGEELLPA